MLCDKENNLWNELLVSSLSSLLFV